MTRAHRRGGGILSLVLVALLAAGCAASPAATAPDDTSRASLTPDAEASATPDEECPAALAEAPTGAVDDPFGPGEAVVIGCFSVVVDAVERDATAAVQAANPGAEPAAGNIFMTVTVTITRTGEPAANAGEVKVVLAGSMTTSGEPDPDLTVDPGPPTGPLEAGQSLTGTYVYEMSGGASTSVELSVGSMTPLNVLPY